eukprot:scaffold297569_cov28-Tisochrysis_lutea.AAC.1
MSNKSLGVSASPVKRCTGYSPQCTLAAATTEGRSFEYDVFAQEDRGKASSRPCCCSGLDAVLACFVLGRQQAFPQHTTRRQTT